MIECSQFLYLTLSSLNEAEFGGAIFMENCVLNAHNVSVSLLQITTAVLSVNRSRTTLRLLLVVAYSICKFHLLPSAPHQL